MVLYTVCWHCFSTFFFFWRLHSKDLCSYRVLDRGFYVCLGLFNKRCHCGNSCAFYQLHYAQLWMESLQRKQSPFLIHLRDAAGQSTVSMRM
jgi:hypothetical protein